MPSMYADDDAFETVYINGKPQKILRDGHKVTIPTRLRDAARSGRGPVTDSYGRTKFNQPGYRFLDIGNREAVRQAYLDYENSAVNAYKNPPGEVGSRNFTDQREGNICTIDGHAGHLRHGADDNLTCVPDGQRVRVTGSKPRDEGREQSSFDPIEDKLSEIREALRARGYGAEEIQDFIDRINDEDDDAILRGSVQARIREFEMKRGQGTPRQTTDSAASIRDRQQAHQQRMNKIYRDIELEISSAWRTPAGPTPNVT